MKLPGDAIISSEKLTHYLLVPQERGDKSAYLAKAGYTQANPEQLEHDIRTQMLALDAIFVETNRFGRVYEIRGCLRGPNQVRLALRSIWMIEHLSGCTKLITLIPDSRSKT